MKGTIAGLALVALVGVSAAFGYWLGRRARAGIGLGLLVALGFGVAIWMTISGQMGGIKGANTSMSAVVFGGPVWIGLAAGTWIGHLRQRGGS